MIRTLALVLLGGCYSPAAISPCEVSCSDDGDCSDGLVCDGSGACNVAGAPKCSTASSSCVVDDFATLDRWTTAEANCTAVPGLGGLVYRCDGIGGAVVTSAVTFDLTNSAVQIEAVQLPENNQSQVNATFSVITSADDRFAFVTGNNHLGTTKNDENPRSTQYDPLQHRHWQLRHTGDAIVFEVSRDRRAWVELDRRPASSSLAGTKVELRMDRPDVNVDRPMFTELAHFTYAPPGCQSDDTPLVRDPFDGDQPDLAGHMAEVGGQWRSLGPGRAGITNGSITHTTQPDAFYLVDPAAPTHAIDVEADVAVVDTTATGVVAVVAQGNNAQQGYGVVWQVNPPSTMGTLALAKLDGPGTLIAIGAPCSMSFGVGVSTPHRLRIRVRDDQVVGYFDGEPRCKAGAMSIELGEAGLWFSGINPTFRVDNVLVTSP